MTTQFLTGDVSPATNLTNQPEFAAHVADTTTMHGATSAATANKLALRDATGALNATKFNPGGSMLSKNNTLDDGSGLFAIYNNLNGATTLANNAAITFGANQSSGLAEADIIVGTNGSTAVNSALRVMALSGTASPYTIGPILFGVGRGKQVTSANNTLDDGSGNLTVAGTVTAASGKLGSASGVWTPAAGTFNVAAGTVINVAAIPSAAKMFMAQVVSGTSTIGDEWGLTTPSGSAWWSVTQGGTTGESVYTGFDGGISSSSVTGQVSTLYDGSYSVSGHFQVNGGYLQFVTNAAGVANTSAGCSIRWGVS